MPPVVTALLQINSIGTSTIAWQECHADRLVNQFLGHVLISTPTAEATDTRHLQLRRRWASYQSKVGGGARESAGRQTRLCNPGGHLTLVLAS